MFFKKKDIYVVKSNNFNQTNIMHEYTERERINTEVKLEHITCGDKCTLYTEVKNYAEWSEAKKFWNLKKTNILLC